MEGRPLTILVVLLAGITAAAQARAEDPSARDELSVVYERLAECYVRGDAEAIGELLAPDFGMAGWSRGDSEVTGSAARDELQELLARTDFTAVTYDIAQVRKQGPDVSVTAEQRFTASLTSDDETWELHDGVNRLTHLWVRADSGWQLKRETVSSGSSLRSAMLSMDWARHERAEWTADQELALVTVRELVDREFTSIAEFSPVVQEIAVLARDGGVRIMDASGQTVRTLRTTSETMTSLAYSPEGTRLMAGTRAGRVLVWDLATGTHEVVFEVPATAIARVAWLGDSGQGVATVSMAFEERRKSPCAFVFDVATGEVVHEFSCFGRDDFQTLATTPDGEHVVLVEIPDKPRGAFLIARETGEIVSTMYDRAHGSGPLSVCVGPDGNTIAVGYAPRDIILWKGIEETKLRLLDGHGNWVVALGFAPDGERLVSGAGDSTARVWNVATGKEIGRIRFPGTSTYVCSVGFSPDGKLILAASRGRVVIAEAPGLP